MKKIAVFLALVLTLVMLVSAITVGAYSSIGEVTDGYGEYGYYVCFDFENFDSDKHKGSLDYLRDTNVKTAEGTLCDPFGLVMQGGTGSQSAKGSIQTDENGNKYFRNVQPGVTKNIFGAFAVQTKNGANILVGDSVELNFKFRMVNDGVMAAKDRFRLINLHRAGSDIASRIVEADIYGNLYVYGLNINGATSYAKVYTNPGDGKFMDISFRWYDVTNTYSLYVNGEPVAEGLQVRGNLRSSSYVNTEYNDDFGVADRSVAGASASGNTTDANSAIILGYAAGSTYKFTYDIDDVRLSRYETAQRGAVYYENSFDGRDDLSNRFVNAGAYVFSEGVVTNSSNSDSNIKKITDTTAGNKYLSVANGHWFGLVDDYYQLYTQANYVIEFKVKASPAFTSGNQPLVTLLDSHTDGTDYLNKLDMLWVGSDGKIYLESGRNNAEKTLVQGITLNSSEWLDVVIVATKYASNAGKFGSFGEGVTASASDQSYVFSYYLNGKYVGSAREQVLYEWKITDTANGTGITASNDEIKVTHTEGTLDTDGLIKVDSETTAGHVIYKSADGLTYYDVESGSYSAMTVTRPATAARQDTLRFFEGFEGYIDDIRIYEGTSPESVYEAVNTGKGGVIFDLDFEHFAGSTALPSYAMTGSGNNALGTARQGYRWDKFDRVDDYAHIKSHEILDLFLPIAEEVDGERNVIYSFETTIKNIAITPTSDGVGRLYLFQQYFNLTGADGHKWLFYVDADNKLYAGTPPGIPLYGKDGQQIVLDNENWNTLRADVAVNKRGENSATANVSYYYNGQPLYREDGSLAYGLVSSTYLTGGYNKYYANGEYGNATNFKTRFTQEVKGKATFDIKSIKINANALPDYSDVLNEQIIEDGGVSEIKLTLNKSQKESFVGYYTPFTLVKKTADGEKTLYLISVDGVTGRLAIGSYNKYYDLFDKYGNPIVLGDEPMELTVVFDDVADRARYYAGGELTYISVFGSSIEGDGVDSGVSLTPAIDLSLYSSSFAELEGVTSVGYRLFEGFGAEQIDCALEINAVNDGDTAEIIGVQQNDISREIRVVAGVDSLCYSNIGFEVEVFEDGVSGGMRALRTNTVHTELSAEDKDITAERYGYNYFAAFKITDLPAQMSEDTFVLVRSYTNVNGQKHYYRESMIIYNDFSYSFFDGEPLYENDFGGEGGALALSENAGEREITLFDAELGKSYTVSADLTMTDINGTVGSMGLAFKAQGDGSCVLASVDSEGKWSIGCFDGGYTQLCSESLGKALTLGKTYRISVVSDGSRASLFIDGIFVGEAQLPEAYTEGKAGVFAVNAEVTVDNVKAAFALGNYDKNLLYRKSLGEIVDGMEGEKIFTVLDSLSAQNFVYGAEIAVSEKTDGGFAGLTVDFAEDRLFAGIDAASGEWAVSFGSDMLGGQLAEGVSLDNAYLLKVIFVNGKLEFYIDNSLCAEYNVSKDRKPVSLGVCADGTRIVLSAAEVFKKTGVKLTAATFNVGDYSGSGIEAGSDSAKEAYRGIFANTDVDVWALQEDTQYFTGTTTSKEAVYDGLYTYYVTNYTKAFNRKSFLSDYEITDAEAISYATLDYEYAKYDHAWFYTGKIRVDGTDITVISLHFDHSNKIRRNQQIADVIAYAQTQEYCIIMGDFNPQNRIQGETMWNDPEAINPGTSNMYQIDWQSFIDAGFKSANGMGEFGPFGTLVRSGVAKSPYPWDNVFVSSNIEILDAYTVCKPWMNDHAIMLAELEIN